MTNNLPLTWTQWIRKEYEMDETVFDAEEELDRKCLLWAEDNAEEAAGYWDNCCDTYGDYLAKIKKGDNA